jgi:hypothetical protein
MQESADREPSKKGGDSEQDAAGADSEATSKETLSDLEENEANVGSNTSEPGPESSPDGRLDESDDIKDAGPM